MALSPTSSRGTSAAASSLAGYVFDYAQITSNVACTATTEATANTIVTGNSVTYDGTSIVLIEFWCGGLQSSQTTDNNVLVLLEDTTVLGSVNWRSDFPGVQLCQGVMRFRRTPSAGAHTYTVKGYTGLGTFTLQCGAGGAGDILMPAFLQVVRVG
jgi:hypothetical protein